MKTRIYTTALIAMITLVSINLNASVFTFEEENYIDDIPFNTETIVEDCNYIAANTVEFQFDEEADIDDIPFNTEMIAAEVNYKKAVEETYAFDDETYINDIPFSTQLVVENKMNKGALTTDCLIAGCHELLF